MVRRHEIPTHLNVEDKAFLGLSVRQFMDLCAGLAGSYGLWNQWPALPAGLRLAIALAALALAVSMALLRPGGRRLEEWAFALLRYLIVARTSIWSATGSGPRERRAPDGAWEDLHPRVSWNEASL